MERIIVTRPVIGLCHMQVCAAGDASDEEILAACNRLNPSGTTLGWATVIRQDPPDWDGKSIAPATCASHPERTHFIVAC